MDGEYCRKKILSIITMDIQETTFGPRSYVVLRKTIATSKIADKQMYDQAGKKLWAYIGQHKLEYSGSWAVLYFTWDEQKKETDMAIAFPVKGVGKISDGEFSSINIPSVPAAKGVLKGSYDGLGKAHEEMMAYAKEQSFQHESGLPMAIEEYVVDPWKDKNPENFITNLWYLHT